MKSLIAAAALICCMAAGQARADCAPLDSHCESAERKCILKRHIGRESPDFQRCVDSAERSAQQQADKLEYQRLHRAEQEKAEQAAAFERAADQRARAALPDAAIGMTMQEVEGATNWGVPDRVNRTVTADGAIEQWVYNSLYSSAPPGHFGDSLYFRDGVLFAIQSRRSALQ